MVQNFELAPDESRVGLFAVQLESICLKKFMFLRKLLPKKEYTLIKSKISSRLHRQKSKDLLVALKEENRSLLRQN